MNNKIITISGDLGSGKSSVAKKLCELLNYKYLSTGLIQRELAKEMNMNTLELNKYSENNPKIDQYIDQRLIALNNLDENLILDSRLAWHFIKTSFKIYLLALPEIAASRVLNDSERTGEPSAKDIEDLMSKLKERRTLENSRFKKLYGIDSDKFKNYDLIVDTSTASIKEVCDLIILEFNKWKHDKTIHKIWLSPKRIYPLENIRLLADTNAKELKTTINAVGYNINSPIEVVLSNKDFFLWNGHKRLSAALYNNINLIPVNIIAKDNENIISSLNANEHVKNSYNLSWIYDWEDAHRFRFMHYPKINQN